MRAYHSTCTLLAMLIAAFLLQVVWGFVPSASKFVIDEIPVELYITLRWSISGAIFAAYLSVTGGWRKFKLRDIVAVSFLGVCGYGIASIGTLYGLKTGGVINFALMSSLSPILSSILAILILRERPEKLFYIALPFVVLGLALLVAGKYQVSNFNLAALSAFFILIGYLMEGLVFVFSKRFKSKMSIAQYLAIAQIAAAVVMWVLQLSVFHQTSQIAQLSARGFAAAIFVSVIACVLCFAVLYWLLRRSDGHRLALFDGVHGLSATMFGVLLFHESFTAPMVAGGVLILAGLVAGNLRVGRAPSVAGSGKSR